MVFIYYIRKVNQVQGSRFRVQGSGFRVQENEE
jgi:hypothetical protein